ncbi:hypothetical protein [Methylobacterium durans]|nr:hypothetical protein [Methylobacterium durans]
MAHAAVPVMGVSLAAAPETPDFEVLVGLPGTGPRRSSGWGSVRS